MSETTDEAVDDSQLWNLVTYPAMVGQLVVQGYAISAAVRWFAEPFGFPPVSPAQVVGLGFLFVMIRVVGYGLPDPKDMTMMQRAVRTVTGLLMFATTWGTCWVTAWAGGLL